MNEFKASVLFADGVESTFGVPAGTTLLEAALAANVPFQHQCKSGSCGSCMTRLLAGDMEVVEGNVQSLLPSDIVDGWRLGCSSIPKGDTWWALDYKCVPINTQVSQKSPAIVKQVRWVSRSVAELEVILEEPFAFKPGQYIRIAPPGADTARSISMASAPSEIPRMRFLVRYVPGGVLSEYLRLHCKLGDRLTIEGPYGTFLLPTSSSFRIMVAGGTGLAPMISMLDAARETPDKNIPTRLVFGTSSPLDAFYLDELELRKFWMPRLEVDICVQQTAGRLDAAWHVGTVVSRLKDSPPPENATAMLCGPPMMISAVREELEKVGLAAANIVSERFQPT